MGQARYLYQHVRSKLLHQLYPARGGARLLQHDCTTVPDLGLLRGRCYAHLLFFLRLIEPHQSLSAAGILPSTTKTYTLSQIQAALTTAQGVSVTVNCKGSTFNEIWYSFNVLGSVQTGQFKPTVPGMSANPNSKLDSYQVSAGSGSTCPSTGIQYLPKNSASTPTSTSVPKSSVSTTVVPISTAPSGSFEGSGYLQVQSGGKSQGCIISAGTWYVSGSCATFKATASGTSK